MVITLIGLSGCGKSHLAERLEAERGFERICVDDRIEQRLAPELAPGRHETIHGVADWLGQPYEPQFVRNQALYLEHEAAVTREVVEHIASAVDHLRQDIVIDTTGSVIYLPDALLQGLKQHSRIVYLAVPETYIERMLEQYFAHPKPVIWDGLYLPRPGEDEHQALKRLYPELVALRAARYAAWADVTIVMDRRQRDAISMRELLNLCGAVSR